MLRIIVLIIFLYSFTSDAQEFYICDFNNTTNQSAIRLIDANFEVTHVVDIDQNAGVIFDIAFDGSNGKMYATSSEATLIEINLNTGSFQVLYISINRHVNNLVYNSNNELVFIEEPTNILKVFSLDSGTITSSTYIGHPTPGDLTYYKGNLIFQSFINLDIVNFDGTEVRTVACGEPVQYFGFSNHMSDCNTNLLYAFSENGIIYEYNIENNSFSQVANIGAVVEAVYGATSFTEYLASNCPLVTLAEVNCNIGVSEEELLNITIYPNPFNDKIYLSSIIFEEDLFYSIYTVDGKLIGNDALTLEIDVENLASGLYFLNLHNATRSISVSKKIIKN